MPQGPGEDILDAIESGAADDAIMSKYKIDGNQLKAFRSLHYGLSNQKMAFDEIESYYPELNKYFKLGPYLPKEQTPPAKQQASTIEKPDFTKPVKQKNVAESTAAPATLKSFQQSAESGKAGETLQEKFDKGVEVSKKKVNEALQGHDDVVEKMIRTQRYNQSEQAGYNEFANAPRTDMPAANMLATMKRRYIEPEAKAQDLPVAPEEVHQLKSEIQSNEPQARQFINQVIVNKPDQAKDLQESIYRMDADQRMKENPEIGLKVNKNLNDLKDGKLKYNAQTGQLIREEGFFDALVSGVKERTKQLHDYDLFQKPDAEVIDILEKRIASYDPDEPVAVPTGAGEIGQMTGMEWAALLKGGVIGAAATAVGGEAAAPYVTAAINAPEYFMRGSSTALEQSYRELRAHKKSPVEALKLAREQAETEGKLGAAEGAISSFIGGKIGLRGTPKFNITSGFKSAAKDVLSKTTHYAAETTIDGLVDGLAAGYLQERKDVAAQEKGMFRDTEQNIKDNIKGEVTFALAIGGVTKAGSKLVDPKTYTKLMYWLGKQPPESVNQSIGEMVINGELTKEDADDVKAKITKQKKIDETIPEDIKDVSRQAMHNKIERRQELEKQLETTDAALHPPLKEEIKKLNEEILEHSTHKIEKNESETEAEAQTEAVDGRPLLNDQTGAGNKVEESVAPVSGPAPANEMRYTNPEGTVYVLRDDKLFQVKKNGEEVEFSEKAMQSENSQELIQQIKEANTEKAAETKQQEITVETPEDFEKHLNGILQNKKAGFGQMAEPGNKINNQTSENTFDEYHSKAQAVLKNLFPDIEVKVYDKANDYYNQEGRPKGSQGYYDPTPGSRKIAFNLEEINRNGLQRKVFHEAIHPIVNQVIGSNENALNDLYDSLEGIKDVPGMEGVWQHMNQYFNRGGKIQKVEAVTEFLALAVDGKIDTSSLSEKALTKIIDVINRILSALGVDKQISTASDLKRLSDAVVSAFQEQNTESLKSVIGTEDAGASATESLDSLAGDQEDAIRELIKKTPASIPDDKLRELIVKAAGITDAEALGLIDSVRKPPVPPPPVIPTSNLSPESKRISLKKFDKLFEKKTEKKPSWLQKQWESLKNASAYIDNPYRFITKITEDINRQYGLANKEQIPLGRQFEKSAAGRAAIKVDQFINSVIRGRIGNKNYGRLKGDKYQDFQKFLAAKRVLDRLNKQQEKLEAGEASNRQTGNITRQDAEVQLEQLRNKYGDLNEFEARGKAFQESMDEMLKGLTASGILSKEVYDNIKADNDFYAPFSVVQEKLLADQKTQPVGISGIIKRIKGIEYKLPKTSGEALAMIRALDGALNEKIISPEEYFNTAIDILNDARSAGVIRQATFDKHVAALENPGFALNDILDAAANMIYRAEGTALKNRMLQRLYAYKSFDTQGLYIQDVEGFQPTTTSNGETRMVPKQLSAIKVEPGMAAIKLRLDGKDKIVAVNEKAAAKLTTYNNYDVATWMRVADSVNKLFRAAVITLSPGFQVVNFAIDFVRTSMLSRYGPIAGKGLVQPIVNAALFAPQYIEALLHSALGNVGIETKAFKQWMESDSFSKGMFDNLFTNEKRIKEVSAPLAKRLLNNFIKLKFIDIPGSILEQTHKLATHQRGLSVEGFKPEMFTAMLGSLINRNINPNMSQQELDDAMDRLNYEVQNFAGSPNFPQTHQWMKLTSIFLQFFSARVKGEVTDYRRVANLFRGRGEGVKLSKQDVVQIGAQFIGAAGAIAFYAVMNNLDDKDEEEFNKIPPYHQDNYLHIKAGKFAYKTKDADGKDTETEMQDYFKLPLRGLTATMNVMANSFVKFYKRQNPAEFKKAGMAFLGNASPVNLNGKDERELGESMVSNLTPVFKFFLEYSFNRDTHSHRDIIPDSYGKNSMLAKYKTGILTNYKEGLKPYEVFTDKTPEWAKVMSKHLYEELGIEINAITLDHMENTMGNPTELYDNAIEKRLWRSQMKYPVYTPKTPPAVPEEKPKQ